MESSEPSEGILKRFIKTKWFRMTYVLLIALASSVVMIGTGCLSAFFIPLLMFVVPYYLKEKNIRRYLLNGLAIFLLCIVMVNVFRTTMIVSSPKPDLSAELGNVTLSQGTVDPFTSSGSGTYNFSVVYTSADIVNAGDVTLTLRLFDYLSYKNWTYAMIGNTSRPVAQGWTFSMELTLPEGVYLFYFTATTSKSGVDSEFATAYGLGPKNASWTAYSSALASLVLFDLTFPFTLYLIIIGMYWWAGRARTVRGPSRVPSDQGGGGFECTNCGAEVPGSATRCHRCGAIFEEEEEPVVRAKKIEKGKGGEYEGKTSVLEQEKGK